MPYRIGCDIGGTFTDIIVLDENGVEWQHKTDTVPENLVEGVRNAVLGVADEVGIPPGELLADTERFVNGTTIVTNDIVELDGANVGLLTTAGFRDTLRIARSPRGPERDPIEQVNVPDIVSRNCIRGIPERVDYEGNVVVELDEEAVEEAARDLVENEGVEAIATCYLWSFQNPDHEVRTKELIEDLYPDLYVTASADVYPKVQEYERMVATALNAYTAPDVAEYVDEMERELGEMGLDTSVISLMQAAGGSTTPAEAKETPIQLTDSGPVGGVIGSRELGRQLDVENVIAADMGGTSFECSIIEDDELPITEQMEVVREIQTGIMKVDTHTIGAGGGSIAWVDERGAPQIGPMSVGADPGPACYGQGGTDPTLTDAALVLGLISPNAFLGGRRQLDVEAAESALRENVAEPLGRSVEDAAAAIYSIAINSMSNAVRSVTVQEGRDPTGFTMFSYGGALPMFAADICSTLGIDEIVIPNTASIFSAYGLLQADDMRTYSESLFWNPGEPVDRVNEALEETETRIRDRLTAAGFEEDEIEIERQGRFKFKGQLFDYPVTLPDGDLTEADMEDIQSRFPDLYEEEYGPGTAWVESPIVLRGVRVTGTSTVSKRSLKEQELTGGESPPPSRSREVYLPFERDRREVDVYDPGAVPPGSSVVGPAIIEEDTTTVFVPDGFEMSVDRYYNYALSRTEAETDRHAVTRLGEV
jgi:N-methylhydantoinase A